jgi:Ca-activated chloride channel homolog
LNWFKWPWAMLAILLLPYLGWRLRRFRHGSPAILFPSIAADASMTQPFRQRWIQLPNTLRLLALALLIAASAGPLWDLKPARQIANSIGIQMLVDRSSSMASKDMFYQGQWQSRLDVVKKISHDFIFGAGRELKGRPSDMIGLITFAADPITLCPLTLTHEVLEPALSSIQVAEGEQDGTAIGDAVALAAARFELVESKQSGQMKSRVIILITDGENNLGARSVAEAAALARQWAVRVYAIALRPTAQGDYEQQILDQLELLSIETSGSARVASDGSALRAIYTEIDTLEKTDVNVIARETHWGAFSFLILTSMTLLAVEVLLNQTWMRRVP